MKPPPVHWKPVEVTDLQRELGAFRNWVLCGGHSIDHWLGRATRPHGDVDVGVFRSELRECLTAIGEERVFLCSPPGSHLRWRGGEVPESVHDIWVSDPSVKHWMFQIMVFDDRGDQVIYRRDRRVHWSKQRHAIEVGGVRILNPFVTLLYKTNKSAWEDKDATDIANLVEAMVDPGVLRDAASPPP